MKICKVEGCNDKVLAHDFCNKHLIRFHKYGDPAFTKVQMHGLTKHPLYFVWHRMMNRCYDKRNKRFCHYGGRGIKVDIRWHKCVNFIKDMYPIHKEGLQIDRIDNNGNYTKNNCRWATSTEQNRNRRNNRLLTYKGRTQCISAWAKELGMKVSTLYMRITTYCWSNERALTTPIKGGK